MFKKSSRRNFQSRLQTTATEDESSSVAGERNAPAAVDLKKPTPSRIGATFDLHDADNAHDGSDFQLKKSKRSQKLAEKQREAARRERNVEDATTGVAQPVIFEQVPLKDEDDVVSGEVAEQMGVYCNDGASKSPTIINDTGAHEFRRNIQASRIPNAKLIFEAKRQRQIARSHEGVIPLPKSRMRRTDSKDMPLSAGDGGRLLREDNSDHSDDEDSGMPAAVNSGVRFMAQSRADIHRQRAEQEAELDERIANLTAEDEDDTWEREQLKKVPGSLSAAAKIRSALAAHHQTSGSADASKNANGTSSIVTPASIKLSVQLLGFDDMKNRVGQRLHAVHDVLSTHKVEQTRLQAELESCTSKVTRYDEQLLPLAGESDFYREMLDYVHAALECYSVKSDQIDRVVDEAREALRVAQEHRVLARKTFVKDMDEDVRTNAIAPPAGAQKSAVMTPLLTPDALERKFRLQAHAEKLSERRRRTKSSDTAGFDAENYDDFSCDNVASNLAPILTARDATFDDTHEDYYSITKILARFSRWSIEYGIVYDDAYVDECLAKMLEPVVKWSLTGWVPWEFTGNMKLENGQISLNDRMSGSVLAEQFWFRQVQLFCAQRRAQEQSDTGDANSRRSLSRLLLENVVLNVLALQIYAWDPYSNFQTDQLVQFSRQVLGKRSQTYKHDQYDTASADHPNAVLLLKNLKDHAAKVIADTVYFPLYPRQILETNVPAHTFYNQQFWTISKLFGNLLKFYGTLPNADLKQLAVTSLLNRYLLMPLRTARDSVDTLEKACRLGELLPEALCDDWCLSFEEQYLQELTTQCAAVAKAHVERMRKATAAEGGRAIPLLQRMVEVLKKLKDYKSAQFVEKELLLNADNSLRISDGGNIAALPPSLKSATTRVEHVEKHWKSFTSTIAEERRKYF